MENFLLFLGQVMVLMKEGHVVQFQLLVVFVDGLTTFEVDLLATPCFFGFFFQFGNIGFEVFAVKDSVVVETSFLFQSGLQQLVVPFNLVFFGFEFFPALKNATPDNISLE